MQHNYVRTQVRIPQELYEQTKTLAESTNRSLNEVFLDFLETGLVFAGKTRRRLTYNQVHTKDNGKADYLQEAANLIHAFFQRHPQYELLTIESTPTGARWWYTYPTDDNGKEILSPVRHIEED